jgi:protein arginine N-methyltransferase 1
MDLKIFTGESNGSSVNPAGPEAETVEEHLLGQFIPLHYHFAMLQDEVRITAFREAIKLHVEPGMNVLELGGGTGVLSYFAAKQGAHVWCVERNPEMVQASRRLLKQNGVGDRVDVIEADATKFLPPERVDVVVCEMLQVAMLREKQLQVIESFKQRYLAEFGGELPKFIPDSSLMTVQPVKQCYEFAGYHAPIPMFQAPGA